MLSLVLAAALAAPSPAASPASNAVCTKQTQPFTGTICVPSSGKPKYPAMILLGGSEGGDSMARVAERFASKGYVTASVAYFGLPGLPQTLVDVPVETVGAALSALAKRDDVDAARIGILGGSKGGELALLAASTYPQIKAVVAIVPSPIGYMGLGERDSPTGCSWSAGGKPLPCVPASNLGMQQIGIDLSQHKPLVLRTLYDASRNDDPATTKAAFFPLQKISGPVLCLSAADDQMWNSTAQCDLAMSYLKDAHHAYPDRAIAYPDAGHTFIGATHGPSSAVTSIDYGGVTMAFGGTKAGDAAAADAAWPVIWSFLARSLGGK
ncbi:MAG TPA: acyl-CoA thioester hydrolase/BAAT C-terminal domain-containing protein [Candidatus Acidoferrales bacterium]|jgi:dienelactone hydrolase|nr:acyl-CoA thioester hydrolase/BAAT C-terminal domain-containing protein [Candidatus Acidoferrales bacterium]